MGCKNKSREDLFFLSFMFLQEFLQEIGVTGGEMSFFFVFHFSPVINYTIGPFVERATWNNIDALLKHTP